MSTSWWQSTLRVSLFTACCLVFLPPSLVFAQNTKTVQMGISFSIPPWVIKEEDSGIELDILKAAFATKGYKIKPSYMPFALVNRMFDAGKLDGVINAKPGVHSHGYLSDTVVTFQNVAISLQDKRFPDTLSMTFLNDKHVVAFQNAEKLLGKEFSKMALNNANYQEIANQSLQINLLFVRNMDFIVMDKSIFGYFWRQATLRKQPKDVKMLFDKPVRFHSLFKPSPYAFIFKDIQVRDDFNEGLKLIKERGVYDKIFNRYDHLTDLYQGTKP